jgi:hypothetical protein
VPQNGIHDVDAGFGPSFCSFCDTGIEWTLPFFDRAMMRSREMASCVKFWPLSVFVGSVTSFEYATPHWSRSPFSSIAAPKLRSNLISRSSFPSKYRIRLGVFMNFSSESGATTFPAFEPHVYTPGFSQLFCTCKCCELMIFRLSSADLACRRGASNLSSTSSSFGGSSACTSRMIGLPLTH